jgi:prolipoprotein diacylglyceryltransferase
LCFVIYYFKFAKGKVPAGRTVGLIFFVIFTARFIIEFFKEVQVSKEMDMTLDIGQILSIPILLAGLVLLIYSIVKRDNIPVYKEINWQKNKTVKK